MKFLFLPALGLLTVLVLRMYGFLEQRRNRNAPSRFSGKFVLGFALALIAFSLSSRFSFSPWLQVLSPADTYERYRLLLHTVPLTLQGTIGLCLLLFASVLTLSLFLRNAPAAWRPYAALIFLLWCLIYPLLPFHLSAPDFDDFFVFDKFMDSVQSNWANDKPFFCIYDYFYRISDLLPGKTSSPFLRFAVNGWIYVIFQLNFALILWRSLGDAALHALGRKGAVAALFLALLCLGPVVLSHGLPYELAGAALYLLSFNVLESLRLSDMPERRRESLLSAWCALILLFQFYSTKQLNLMWLVAFGHAGLILFSMGRLKRHILLWIILLSASSMIFFRVNSNGLARAVTNQVEPGFIVFMAYVVVLALLAARSFYRSGRLSQWVKDGDSENTTLLVYALYVFTGIVLMAFPNKLVPGIPFPLHFNEWDWGTNHARYSLLFYPFASAAAGYLAFNLKSVVPRLLIVFTFLMLLKTLPFNSEMAALLLFTLKATPRRRMAFFILLAVIWNHSYLTGFYFSLLGPENRVNTASSFQRNMRPYMELKQKIEKNTPGAQVFYLPIPRDHADNYLMRAVDPQSPIRNICNVAKTEPDALLLISRNTQFVVEKVINEKTAPGELKPLFPTRAPCRSLDDTNWQIQFIPASSLDRKNLVDWCRFYRHPMFEDPPENGDESHAIEINSDFTNERKDEEWIIPAGREERIRDIFFTGGEDNLYIVKNIQIGGNSQTITLTDRDGGTTAKLNAKYTADGSAPENCTVIDGLQLCPEADNEAGGSALAADYIRRLQALGYKSDVWKSIWEKNDRIAERSPPGQAPDQPFRPDAASALKTTKKINSVSGLLWVLMLGAAYGHEALKAVRKGRKGSAIGALLGLFWTFFLIFSALSVD